MLSKAMMEEPRLASIPRPVYVPPTHNEQAVHAAGLALSALDDELGADGRGDATRTTLNSALAVLPGALYDDDPPATERDWRGCVEHALGLLDSARTHGLNERQATLLRIARASLRSVVVSLG